MPTTFTTTEASAASALPINGGMTKLSAINEMLQSAGLRPVVALDSGGDSDVALAEASLDDVDLELQSNGYFFNYEEDVEIAKDANNQIRLAANIIDVEPVSPANSARRGSFLYDLDEQDFAFTSNATVHQIIRVAFEDCPATFREWVVAEASVRFQRETIGSTKIDAFARERLVRVRSKFLSHDARVGRYGLYRSADALGMRGRTGA